ncbi:Os04g0204200, partial [Oryza sativa Japonica Group]
TFIKVRFFALGKPRKWRINIDNYLVVILDLSCLDILVFLYIIENSGMLIGNELKIDLRGNSAHGKAKTCHMVGDWPF